MKINRTKAIRKYLRFFRLVFGIKAPYNVILDGNFIFEAIKSKVDLLDRIKSSLMGDEVRLFVTSSIIAELKKIGSKGEPALEFATKYCEEIDDSKFLDFGEAASDRLSAMIKQNHDKWTQRATDKIYIRYFVATQDKKLRKCLGGIPGTPLFYLNNVSFVMEPPSQASKSFNNDLEGSKVALNSQESAIVEKLKTSTKGKKRKLGKDNVVGAPSTLASVDPQEKEALNKEVEQRIRKRARESNPLASRAADTASAKSKKRKAAKFKRGA